MIVINSSTRQFNIPGAEMTFGVEADAGSERKYFQCPRYVGNKLDIASSFVRINYRNANGEVDSYLVEDLEIDGDNVLFSWELYPKVTAYKGQVRFVMCVVGPDTKVAWHTTLGTGVVLEGLEPDYAVIQAGTADVVAQLIALVDKQTAAVEAEGANQIKAVQAAAKTAEAASVAEIEAKGNNVRESIPDDYTSLENTVDSLVRGRAGAIVCEAAGSAVVVNDASDMAIQGMRIFGRSTQDGTPTPDAPVEIKSVVEPMVTVAGKNILPVSYKNGVSRTHGGLTYTVRDDGSVHVTGTVTAAESYFVLSDFDFGKASVGKGQSNGKYTWSDCLYNGPSHYTMLYFSQGKTVDQVCYPQVERGTTVTEWESPSGQTVELTHTLSGIPVTSGGNYTDSDGQQWICDEVDLERGVYVQRIKTDTVTISSRGVLDNGLSAGICKAPDKLRLLAAGAICDRAKFVGISGSAKNPNCFYENLNNFGFTGAETDTLEMLQAAYDGATVAYILATPIETALSETEIAAYRAMHSNYPNTTVLNDAGAHMVVKYAADTKLYIDNKIAALIGD